MKELQEKLREQKNILNSQQRQYINFQSLENFFLYFDELKEEHKPIVEGIMRDYFNIIERDNFLIDKDISTEISFSHILAMGRYYKFDVGFKLWTDFKYTIFWSIAIDFLLLISGLLKRIYYIPIITLITVANGLYIKIFYVNRNKAYGGRF